MKKLKKILAEHNRKSNKTTTPRKDEDTLWKELVIEYVQKEQYLGAYLMIQDKLRSKAKEDSLVEDKRIMLDK
jgi:hypothetical protein